MKSIIYLFIFFITTFSESSPVIYSCYSPNENHWKGNYYFSSKSRDGLKTSFDINIIKLNNVTVKYVNEGEPVEVYKNIKSEYVDKDKIKINFNPKYENMGIVFIEYADGDYYISGDPIYFINPGNEEMLLKKTD